MQIALLPDEYWWCGRVFDGVRMPVGAADDYALDLREISPNQGMPLLLSTKGRYVWCERPFAATFARGLLTVNDAAAVLREGFGTLAGAYRDACARHFPFAGKAPDELCFSSPVYNTWMEMGYEPSQERVLTYARELLAHGLKPGVLMIDDNWMERYGGWEFNRRLFPDPKRMVGELHALGFRVMLWVCPYVVTEGQPYLALRDRGLLVPGADGQPRLFPWWNGVSALLDWSVPEAAEWLRGELRALVERYGVDGFKFDAGKPDDVPRHAPLAPNEDCRLYSLLGAEFPLAEYRESWRAAGLPLMMRQQDKLHAWDESGLRALIPNGLAQSMLGYAYHCPDMVGGGDICGAGAAFDPELYVRFAQLCALFPIVQFSRMPYRLLDGEHWRCCQEALALRERLLPYLLERVRLAARAGEPILSPLEYEHPHQGFARETQAFCIGDRYVCYPIVDKGATEHTLRLPGGLWRDGDGNDHAGGVTVACTLHMIPLFERVDGRRR